MRIYRSTLMLFVVEAVWILCCEPKKERRFQCDKHSCSLGLDVDAAHDRLNNSQYDNKIKMKTVSLIYHVRLILSPLHGAGFAAVHPGQDEILHSLLMRPCTGQIHRLWCMNSEFGLNSQNGLHNRISDMRHMCPLTQQRWQMKMDWSVGNSPCPKVLYWAVQGERTGDAKTGAPSANTFY